MSSDLRHELRLRAEKTAESLMTSARNEADRIREDAERRIEERRSAVLGKKDRELRDQARQQVAAARHAAMRSVLVAKAQVVERVLEEARSRLPAAAQSEAYRAGLKGEIEDAVAFIGNHRGEVRCSPPLRSAIEEASQGLPHLSVEAADDVGSGFRLLGDEGSVVVDATLETRLERLASTLAIEIHKRLEEMS